MARHPASAILLSLALLAAGCPVEREQGELETGDTLPESMGCAPLDGDMLPAIVPGEGDGAWQWMHCPDCEDSALRIAWHRLDLDEPILTVWHGDGDGWYESDGSAWTGAGTYRLDLHPASWDADPETLWRFLIR